MAKQEKIGKNWFKNNIQIIIVVIFSILVTISLIYINSTSNILGHSYRDVYFYLIQALRFAGYQINGYEYVYYLSPLVPYLTSILFRFGFVSEWSLFTVTGIFYTMATIGMYYLLKLRFNKNISCFGAILYGSLSINLLWAANGTLDICSIALSIWSLHCFILAMEKNQKYFYLAFPLAVLSFLGKYTGALIFAILILYFFSKKDIFGNIKRYFKHLVGGIIAGFITLTPFFNYYLTNNIPFGFINQAEIISSTTTTSANAIARHTENQLFFYLENIPRFVYAPQEILGYFVLILGIIGLIYGTYKLCSYIKYYYKKNDDEINISFIENIKIRKEICFIILFLSLIFMILAFLTASKISFVVSEMIFFASALIFSIAFNSIFVDLSGLNLFTNKNKDLKKQEGYKYKSFNYDLVMIAWFIGYLIFFSAHLVKAERYFTAFAPGFVFFITFSLDTIVNKLDEKLRRNDSNRNENKNENKENSKKISANKNTKILNFALLKTKIPKIIPVLFILILLISTAGYLTMNKHDTLVDDEKDASLWIKKNIPNYNNTKILSDRGPIYTWYLKSNIEYATPSSADKMGEYLNNESVSYFISISENNTMAGFSEINRFGEVIIYKNDRLVK